MAQIRNSYGQIVANVVTYTGSRRSGEESQAKPFMPFAGKHSGQPGRHGAWCACLPGYVCETHRIAR
jgi:hypothetical protein